MPLANAGGMIPGALHHPRDRPAVRLDQRTIKRPKHPALHLGPPGITASEEAIPGRRADRRRAVGIGETHSLRRQSIQIWRGDFRVRVVTPQVAVTQIVGQDNNDVGPAGGTIGRKTQCNKRQRTSRKSNILQLVSVGNPLIQGLTFQVNNNTPSPTTPNVNRSKQKHFTTVPKAARKILP